MDPRILVDVAAEDIDRTILEVLGAQEMRRLNLVASALARIPTATTGCA